MEFFSNFSPIVLCSNLCSKLFEIGEKWLKTPFSILQFTKKAQKAIFWSKIHIFLQTMLALLANDSEPVPNLLGHPVCSKYLIEHLKFKVLRLGPYAVIKQEHKHADYLAKNDSKAILLTKNTVL